jgi:hypothetical protein
MAEVQDAFEAVREHGKDLSMPEVLAALAAEFELDADEMIGGVNAQMEISEQLVRAKVNQLHPVIFEMMEDEQLKVLMEALKATVLATWLKAFGAGLTLMRTRSEGD